jgi:hypothetical protein
MARCIFCPNELSADTAPEHILHNAFGGKKTTREVVCSDCNNRFGGTIDKVFAEQFGAIRNLLQLESGNRNAPPPLKRVSDKTEFFDIQSDGTPVLKGKPFSIEKRPDGRFNVQIRATSESQLAALLPHIAAQIGCTEEELKEQILSQGHATSVVKPLGQIPLALSIGGEDALRSVVKSSLVLWATAVGNEEVLSEPYSAAREFVTVGNQACNKNRNKLDSRTLPCADQLVEQYGKLFTFIYVASDDEGRVIAHFTLYNITSWQVLLAEKGGQRNVRIGLASNPLEPSQWSDAVATEIEVSLAWLAAPAYNLEEARTRFAAMYELYVERGRSSAALKIIEDVFQKNIGKTIDDEIIGEIAHRLALLFLRLPDQRQLSGDELRLLFGI